MGILKDFAEKIKGHTEEVFLVLMIASSVSLGFGLGYLERFYGEKPPVFIEEFPCPVLEGGGVSADGARGGAEAYFVASKNGTRYYFPWCDGAKKISPANLVKFSTVKEAEASGLTKAANCAGL